MIVNSCLAAPCGLYCGACGIYIAHQENNPKLKEKLSKAYGVALKDIKCEGCLSGDSENIFVYCRVCPIKSCAKNKSLEGCFQCDEYPCANVDNFPVEEGKKVILKSVPLWKKIGTENWLKEEEQKYQCTVCSAPQFRGARICRKCKAPVKFE